MGRSWGEFYCPAKGGAFVPSSRGAVIPSSSRRGGAKRRGGQILRVGDANISDPVARSACETRFNIFALEVSGGPTKPPGLMGIVSECSQYRDRLQRRHGEKSRHAGHVFCNG